MERYTDEKHYVLMDEKEEDGAIARLKMYEDTGLLPDEAQRMKRDVDKYKGAGIKYEAEIARLKEKNSRFHQKYELLAETVCELERDNQRMRGTGRKTVWMEMVLFALSSLMAGMAWADRSSIQLLPMYWTMLAGYWAMAIWRRKSK